MADDNPTTDTPDAPQGETTAPTLGKCQENARRTNHALRSIDAANKALESAYTQWTNRTDAPEETTRAMQLAVEAVDRLRRQVVGDHRVWLANLRDANGAVTREA